jgi:malonate decarboxylase beta subunit
MSGPEVIEASHGVEEFDSRDHALVWQTTGGKHRFLSGDCDALVEDDVEAFRSAAIDSLAVKRPLTLASLEVEHTLLSERLHSAPSGADAIAFWRQLGIPRAEQISELDAEGLRELHSSFGVSQ